MGPTAARQAHNGATIYQVAAAAQVSIATVSRVISGSAAVSPVTTARVQDAIDELGYLPLAAARSLAVRALEAHGLILPELSGPYYSELLMGFESRAAELGQSVTVLQALGRQDVGKAARHLAGRVDGLAVLASSAIPDALARSLARTKPVVLLTADTTTAGVESICTDNVSAAEALTGHLLDHGRAQLRFIGDPDLGPDIHGRYAGFVQAHRNRGYEAPPPVLSDLRESGGRRVAEDILASHARGGSRQRKELGGIDAAVCANDELALALMTRLQDAGVAVPTDLAVTGWDDVMTARYIRPGLTTVRQPVRELGALAAQRLHDRVSGVPARTDITILPTEIVLRGSCGCAERDRGQAHSHAPAGR